MPRRPWTRLVLGVFVTLFGVLSLAGPARAQEEATESVGGTLQTKDETGETVLLEGVSFVVRDAEGNEVGSAVTDAEGDLTDIEVGRAAREEIGGGQPAIPWEDVKADLGLT